MGRREQQNKRPHEEIDCGDNEQQTQQHMDAKAEQFEANNDSNNNSGHNNKKQTNTMNKQAFKQDPIKTESNYDDDEELDDEEIEEEVDEEVEEEEEVDEDDDEMEGDQKATKSGQSKGKTGDGEANSGNQGSSNQNKRPRLTNELYEMNLRRKKEHVGSALYIPFPRKVTEEEVRAFVGKGPNIFLVGLQKLNAIVRYSTQSECEKQQKELEKKEFDGATLNIEPKTVKIDPANIDVKTLIVQYSNPDLTIMDFAQIFIKANSISLKGGRSNKKEGQDDLSFGSAIIIFPSHEEAKEAFLATENLNIKNEQLRVVFADFRPTPGTRNNQGPFGFRKSGGGDGANRGNFRGHRGNDRQGGGGGFRPRNRNSSGGGGQGGGGRNFGNRNFNNSYQGNNNSGGGGGGRNYSPNKKFRSNR